MYEESYDDNDRNNLETKTKKFFLVFKNGAGREDCSSYYTSLAKAYTRIEAIGLIFGQDGIDEHINPSYGDDGPDAIQIEPVEDPTN